MGFKPKQIGIIRSPFNEPEKTPIQPLKSSAMGKVKVFNEFKEGLKDIEGFSHIILLYEFHKTNSFELLVKPFLVNEKKGLFATRAPWRPNPIGLSVVELKEVKDNTLKVKGIDCLDKTPLLDIKPFVPEFDDTKKVKIGWLEKELGGEKKWT